MLKLIQKAAESIGLPPTLITEYLVRKLAHLCEYALLGFLMTITTQIWCGKLNSHIFMVLFFGLLIPVSDEFLQLFVAGRAGMVQDIMLDFAGFVIGMWTCIGLSALLKHCKKLLPAKNS